MYRIYFRSISYRIEFRCRKLNLYCLDRFSVEGIRSVLYRFEFLKTTCPVDNDLKIIFKKNEKWLNS
jgi:hypothetical protein